MIPGGSCLVGLVVGGVAVLPGLVTVIGLLLVRAAKRPPLRRPPQHHRTRARDTVGPNSASNIGLTDQPREAAREEGCSGPHHPAAGGASPRPCLTCPDCSD